MSFRQNIDIRSSKLCAQLTVDLYEGTSSQLYTHLLRLRKEILKNIFGGHAKARQIIRFRAVFPFVVQAEALCNELAI